jgi:hypothetical protein
MDPMGDSSTERGKGWREAYSSEGEGEFILGKTRPLSPTYCVRVV